MDKTIITFAADQQQLTKTGGIDLYASDTVSYIEADFDLGENWSGYDSVRAVWYNDFQTIATVLNSLGTCIVPWEVLKRNGKVRVNLVGSISDDNVLTDRLTTYDVVALVVDRKVKVDGDNTTPITPSQFEQFAEAVRTDADRAEAGAESAEQSAINAEESERNAKTSEENSAQSEANALQSERNAKQSEDNAKASEENSAQSAIEAEEWADKAEQSASDAGFMEFYIDERGHLIMEHTQSVDTIDFDLVNGHLILEVA